MDGPGVQGSQLRSGVVWLQGLPHNREGRDAICRLAAGCDREPPTEYARVVGHSTSLQREAVSQGAVEWTIQHETAAAARQAPATARSTNGPHPEISRLIVTHGSLFMSEEEPDTSDIYLSPHYDDIAFSLGTWVSEHPSGTLINIFTRSAYVAGRDLRTLPADEVQRISALRRNEDAAFAERHQLTRIELGAEEPSLRGRWWKDDPAGANDDCGQIDAPLKSLLARLTAGRGPTRLFCPAGIGGHVNHLATRTVVLALIETLQQTNVYLYEDLPYASNRFVRRRGLTDVRHATKDYSLRRRWWPAQPDKLAENQSVRQPTSSPAD